MTWVALAYGGIAYWHFRATLRASQPYDTIGTTILCSTLALTVGPLLLAPAALYGWIAQK